MVRKARQRISYVLPFANSDGHRLGVNSLAVAAEGTLYSAGRDGVICAWDLGVSLQRKSADPSTNENPATTLKTQVQAHTHWVNDIILTHNDKAVVSCSSDLTVKLWRPQSSTAEGPETIGNHTDYVKCLVSPRDGSGGWVASGGLDRKIRIWDLAGKGQIMEIDIKDEGKAEKNPKGSVYALAHGSGVLASGGPESIVRLWDPRSGKQVTKFVGHTDNIRALLVSEQGDYVLSASSDTTIKMWTLTGGRCLHTLSMHNDSVWSLFSSHPRLDIFYSSDRTGLVAKTDIRNVKEIDEGLCVAVAQEREGVRKVVSYGDYLWTTTSSSSIKCWLDVDTDVEVAKSPVIGRPQASSITSARSLPDGHVAHGSHNSVTSSSPTAKPISTIPISSILRLSTTSPLVRDPDAVTVYSVASARQASISEAILDTDPKDMIPIDENPLETIKGQDGLIKHFLLNDRRRVLTLDTAGNVIMWDLIRCKPINSYGKRDLEDVAAEVNTVEAVANWCQVDTRTGQLTCVLEENYCFDAEMYADEIDFETEAEFKEDQRINLGRWVLRCLFDKLITEELRKDVEYRESLDKENTGKRPAKLRQLSIPNIAIDHGAIDSPISEGVATPDAATFPQTPGFSIALASPGVFPPAEPITDDNDTTTPIRTSMQTPRSPTVDYFSAASSGVQPTQGESIPTPASPSTEVPFEGGTQGQGSFLGGLGKFRLGPKKSKNDPSSKPTFNGVGDDRKPSSESEPNNSNASSINPAATAEPIYEETLGGMIKKLRASYCAPEERDKQQQHISSKLTPCPATEAPLLPLPPNTAIIIQSDHPDSGGVSDLYRGTAGSVAEAADIELLEEHAPAWLGEALLLNKLPVKEPYKISFVLVPWGALLPQIGIVGGGTGGGSGGTAAATETGVSRLNANRMLRCRKVIGYVAERLPPEYALTLPLEPKTDGAPPATEGGVATTAMATETETATETATLPVPVEPLKPEDWLELVCQGQVVHPNQTLTTLRSHIWKSGGDVALYYRRKDWKKMQEAKEEEEQRGSVEGARVSGESTVVETSESS
ncbi:WD40 repeat-like protein [Terfezia boudieri ATCC MYA-4762]|uniref:WD40 repeat-like protein n=1 Tax=Terfezia boudieri ATCC MYA-4762 TaxID=1051890 RepID=A0A3N4LF50_9PEZI|nr:WD40 repeat-like protein [Terfezia boudieri ATCC MYA-4762]